jgi:phytoene synthase
MPTVPDWEPARYFAWLYSPASQRPLLHCLFEIERAIASSLRPGLEHQVAHARLQWWREECERCVSGRPAHPLTRALRAAFPGVPRPGALEGLMGLIDTATWDLARATFESRRELTAYCGRWAAAIAQPIVLHSTSTEVDWRTVGGGLCELELLIRVYREALAGRIRLPLEELQAAGVESEALAHPPWPPALSQLLATRHTQLRATLAQALSGLMPQHQRSLRGLLVWARLGAQLSERAQRALPGIPAQRRRDSLAATWQAWDTARRATHGRLRLE